MVGVPQTIREKGKTRVGQIIRIAKEESSQEQSPLGLGEEKEEEEETQGKGRTRPAAELPSDRIER